jgi:hypothetical protein
MVWGGAEIHCLSHDDVVIYWDVEATGRSNLMTRIVSTTGMEGGAESARLGRARWERPTVRHLAARKAETGTDPCNDNGGGNCGQLKS